MERKQQKSKDKEKQKPPEDLETLQNMLALIRPQIKGFIEKRKQQEDYLNPIDQKTLDDFLQKENKAIEQIEKLKNKGI